MIVFHQYVSDEEYWLYLVEKLILLQSSLSLMLHITNRAETLCSLFITAPYIFGSADIESGEKMCREIYYRFDE